MLWPNLTEYQDAWFMPLNFLEPEWVLRLSRTWRGLDTDQEPICDENVTAAPPEVPNCDEIVTEPQEPPAPPEPEISFTETEIGQLTLF